MTIITCYVWLQCYLSLNVGHKEQPTGTGFGLHMGPWKFLTILHRKNIFRLIHKYSGVFLMNVCCLKTSCFCILLTGTKTLRGIWNLKAYIYKLKLLQLEENVCYSFFKEIIRCSNKCLPGLHGYWELDRITPLDESGQRVLRDQNKYNWLIN